MQTYSIGIGPSGVDADVRDVFAGFSLAFRVQGLGFRSLGFGDWCTSCLGSVSEESPSHRIER